MPRWYPLESADDDFFATAPQLWRYEIRSAVPPVKVWESLISDRSLADWGPAVKDVQWHGSRPFGVGATRTVVLPGSAVTVHERFHRWDEGHGYAFHVYESNRPGLRRLAENYVIEPDGDGAVLTWTVALEGQRTVAPLVNAAGPLVGFAFGQAAAGGRRFFAR